MGTLDIPWAFCTPRSTAPPQEKVPDLFVSTMVMEQLLFSGVMESVKIRLAGYGSRMPFRDFVGRYRCVAPRAIPAGAAGEMDLAARFVEHLPAAIAPAVVASAGSSMSPPCRRAAAL